MLLLLEEATPQRFSANGNILLHKLQLSRVEISLSRPGAIMLSTIQNPLDDYGSLEDNICIKRQRSPDYTYFYLEPADVL
jgi:hypothetical protein